jgi:hypothetical protein
MISVADIDCLRHAVAAGHRLPGFRNWYAPGGADVDSMHRLESAGLMARGRPYAETHYFHATKEGCRVAGLGPTATRRALQKGRALR